MLILILIISSSSSSTPFGVQWGPTRTPFGVDDDDVCFCMMCVFAIRKQSGGITNIQIISFCVWNVWSKKQCEKVKDGDGPEEKMSVPSAHRLSSALHYSLNASRCQLYYGKVVPDWRPQWGEKNSSEILLKILRENKGEAVMDGCIWPMQGKRQRGSLPDETGSLVSWCPLCPEPPSLVRGRGNSSSCFRQCFYHLCQNRCCTSADKSVLTWREYRRPARLSRLCGRTDVRALKEANTSYSLSFFF